MAIVGWRAGFGLFLSLASSALAAPEPFLIQTNRPAHVYYREVGDSYAGNPYRQAEAKEALRYVGRADFAEVEVLAEDPHGLIMYSDRVRSHSGKAVTVLNLKPGPNWSLILPLAGLAVLLAMGWRWRRQISHTRELALKQEPLIRSDGELPRRRLSGYRLIKKLGAGAMGVVYLGQDDRGSQCAIKVPMPHFASNPDFASRFQREVKLGMQLRHPRIVQLLALPIEEEAYIMMELVQGQSLEEVPVQPLQQELQRCREWGCQILEALAYIHSQGIIHRDLKPANIMVQPAGDIKLMDFGVAHDSERTKLTATGTVLGTPTYMAPEQLQGSPCDPSIDIYALGLILYERLNSGKLPYPADFMELLRDKLKGPLPSLRERIPQDWADFLQDLAAQRPEDRPDAARALDRLKSLKNV